MMTCTSGAQLPMTNLGAGCRFHRGRTYFDRTAIAPELRRARYGLDVRPVGTAWTGAGAPDHGRNGGRNE
jgi:hypothetical protein